MELTTLAQWTIRPRLHGRPRRRQRRDLGTARPPAPGARRSRAAARQRRHARRRGRAPRATRPRSAAGGFIDTPNQRLAVAHVGRGRRRPTDLRAMPSSALRARRRRRCAARRRRRRGRGLPAADRRRGHQRRRRACCSSSRSSPGATRCEVTRDVEAALEALAPGLDGRRDRLDHLPAGDLHRDVARQPEPRAADRLRAGGRRPGRLPLRLAHRADQPDRDPALAARRGARPPLPGRHASTRWCSPGSSSRSARWSTTPSSTSRTSCAGCGSNARSRDPRPAFRVVLDASLEVRSAVVYASLIVVLVFLPVFFLRGPRRLVLPAARAVLRARRSSASLRRRADRDAGAVAAAAAAGARARSRESPLVTLAQGALPRVAAAPGRRAPARDRDRHRSSLVRRGGRACRSSARSSCRTSRSTTS